MTKSSRTGQRCHPERSRGIFHTGMNNYEYIMASLPDITTGWKFGEKGPQDYMEELSASVQTKTGN